MNKLVKTAFATTLGATLILAPFKMNASAQQVMPDISEWAIETLNEGEKYGIFPLDWYYEDFRKPISQERLIILLERTEAKIASLGLNKNEAFTPVPVKNDNTRGDIINRLFNIVAQYDINAGDNVIKYLQEHNVLRGSEQGLMLEEKATTQHAAIFAIRLIQDTYEQVNGGGKGVAWVVEDDDTTIYLLGSIHLGIPDLYPINNKLVTAFNESQGLFVEANTLDPKGMEYYMEKAIYQDGQKIQNDISKETYEKLEKVATQLNIPMKELETMKPWLLANNFSTLTMGDTYGFSGEELMMHGIDRYFLLSAYLQQKPIYELEGMATQVDMFNGLSKETQDQTLASVLDTILEPVTQTEEDVELLSEWFMNWKIGDIDNFAKSLVELEGDDSEYNKMLFGKRDEDMSKSIMEVLENEIGQFFVVVGAGHFLVDQNIRFHLEQGGYQVTPFYEK